MKYGICLNEDCPKAKAKEVQAVPMRKDLVCSECGKPLRECPPPKKKGGMLKTSLIASSIVILLCAIGYAAFVFIGKGKSAKPQTDTSASEVVEATPKAEPVSEPAPEIVAPKDYDYLLPFGTYEGKLSQEGLPHGVGGIVTVTKSYQIDLKDAKGGKLIVGPGDVIKDCIFKNGRFAGGTIHRSNGEIQKFNIGV